jgi:RHS repeat-associated protein
VGDNTSNGNGPANSFGYDPFGNVLPNSALPANTTNGSYGWVGQHQKLSEIQFTLTPLQMGVRVYLPGIGRFVQADPVEGGTQNSYAYPVDPINGYDLSGAMSMCLPSGSSPLPFFSCQHGQAFTDTSATVAEAAPKAIKGTGQYIGRNSNNIGLTIGVGGLAACIFATAGVCAVVGGGIATGAAGTVGFMGAKYDGNSWAGSAAYGGMSAGLNRIPGGGKALRALGSRNYKSARSALTAGKGKINPQAIRRGVSLIRNFTIGTLLDALLDLIWVRK